MRKSKRVMPIVVCGVLFASGMRAQEIEIAWYTAKEKPKLIRGEKVVIDKPTKVEVLVSGVNDLLYDHKVKSSLVPKTFSDAADIFGAANVQASAMPGCSQYNADKRTFTQAWTAVIKEGADSYSKKYVPLEDTLQNAPAAAKALDALRGGPEYSTCAGTAEKAAHAALADALKRFFASKHEVTHSVLLDPAFDLRIEVAASTQISEDGSPAKPVPVGDKFVVTIGVYSNQVSMSVGVLQTGVESRKYVSRNSVANGAVVPNVLIAEDVGRPLTGVALLNYRLDDFPVDKFKVGLSLSAGPSVASLTGNSNTSFGFFYGITLRFWDRLFISPGFHSTKFGDFPTGLQNYDVVPKDYGALTSPSRWTTRFGWALTFRTNDFSWVKKATGTTGGTAPQAGAK